MAISNSNYNYSGSNAHKTKKTGLGAERESVMGALNNIINND
jgi:hypothetical protein